MPPDPADLPVNPAFAEAFVLSCYRDILGREPDAAGFAAQASEIKTQADYIRVLEGFCHSQEFADKLAVRRLQKPVQAGERLYFYHLLKTGGTSVHTWLRSVFGQQLFPHLHMDDLLTHHARLQEFSVFSGHFEGVLDRLLGGVSRRFTVVREPLDRAISLYFHHRLEMQISDSPQDVPPASSARFVELLYNERWRMAFAENAQFKSLYRVHDSDKTPVARYPMISSSQQELMENHFDKTLAAFELVGRFEDLPGFVARLAKLIGLENPPPVPRRNVSAIREDVQLSDADKAFFYEHNQVDLQLYEWSLRQA